MNPTDVFEHNEGMQAVLMAGENNDLRKPVVAVQRAVQILRFLGRHGRPAGVNEIARALDIVPSTCLHILRTLAHDGLLSEDLPSKKYQLGPTLLRFARDMVGSNDFVRNAQQSLDRIAQSHQVTAAAVWREQADRIIVVAKAHAPSNFSIHVNIGSRFPALTSAIGYCFAANGDQPAEQLRPSFEQLKWHAKPTFESWLASVEAAGRSGYAVDAGQYIGGVTIVVAPVLEADGTCARAIAGVGLLDQLKGPALQALADSLKGEAAALSGFYAEVLA